jgi:hypothetical protein
LAKVIERDRAHYDVQEVEFGKVYKWRPKSVLIECECGERVALTLSKTLCEECGAEYTMLVRENLIDRRLREDERLHPWRYSEDPEDDTGLPY